MLDLDGLEAAEGPSLDVPACKPKRPFLKRGEGVNKRLNAYKLREQAEALRKQCSSSNSRSPEPGDLHDLASSTSSPSGNRRRTWQKHSDQTQQQQQSASQGQEWQPNAPTTAAGGLMAGMSRPMGAQTRRDSWTASQDVEDLELEEFRALEREILGDSGHSSLSRAAQQHPQVSSQQQQQQQQQQQEQQQYLNDDAQAAGKAGLQHSVPVPEETHAAQAADRHPSISPLDQGFQDDTEWVDTEFSFADLSPATQQDQTRPGGQQQEQLTRQHPPRLQQQEVQHQQQSVGMDTGVEEPLAQQRYVRSIFKQQQQQQQLYARPVSSNGRLGTAASRKGAHGSKPAAGLAAAGAAAVAEAADPEGAGQQQLVAVPAAVAERLQELEAAQSALQQEKAALRKMRKELERAAHLLEQQRAAWERDKAAQQASIEAWKTEEAKQLANRRRVLDQQYKAMYKLPTKKEKTAMEAIEAALERERSEAKAAAARHKLTVERLRCQVKQLQETNNELHEELRWHGAQQLNSVSFAVQDSRARKKPSCHAGTQTEPVLSQPLSRASAQLLEQAEAWSGAEQTRAAPSSSKELLAALFGEEEEDEEEEGDAAISGPASARSAEPRQHQQEQQLQQGQAASSVCSAVQGDVTARHSVQPALDHSMGDEGFSFAQLSAARGSQQPGPQQTINAQQDQHQHRQQQHGQRPNGYLPAGDTRSAAAMTVSRNDPAQGMSSAKPASSSAGSALRRELLRRYAHPDGKMEELYDDGSREVQFVNGTLQVHRPDGSTLVFFVNGDVKRQWCNARVDYYYAEVCVWQCTHPDGLDVFYYPTGQVEGHFPDGRKEVIFADGAARIVVDGRDADVTADMLSQAVLEPPPDLSSL